MNSMMSRMEWLSVLRSLMKTDTDRVPIAMLLERLQHTQLSLEPPAVYYAQHKAQPLSLAQVTKVLTAWSDPCISWDQLLDTLVLLSLSEKPIAYSANQVEDTVEITFPEPKLTSVPVRLLVAHLQYLSLAGNALQHTQWPFPANLVVLNLAANELNELVFTTALQKLRLLNVTNNRIERVESVEAIKAVSELFIGYNRISSLTGICQLKELKVLDLCYNKISVWTRELDSLSHLEACKLKGNPSNPTHPLNCTLNPPNILDFSHFRTDYLPFVPLRRKPVIKDSSLEQTTEAESILTAKTLLNQTVDVNALSIANQRITKFRRPRKVRKSVIVTKELIQNSNKLAYDNPVKAVMIVPASKPKLAVRASVSLKHISRKLNV